MNSLKTFLDEELHLDPAFYLKEFLLYEKLLLDWNKKINLISRQTGSIESHILNSIFFLTKFHINHKSSVADIGTGGGFPGIPLKILIPELEVVLIDSIQKKANALNDIVSNMKFKNTEVLCGRAEEISKSPENRKRFDFVISKAVATLDKLFDWGSGLLKSSGKMICIKGGDIENEIAKLNKKKYKINIEVVKFHYPEIYNIENKKIVVISFQ